MTINWGTNRKYIGVIQSETQAARFYDKYAICIWGTAVSCFEVDCNCVQAKTNFSYTPVQVVDLLSQTEYAERLELKYGHLK